MALQCAGNRWVNEEADWDPHHEGSQLDGHIFQEVFHFCSALCFSRQFKTP